MLPLPTKLIDDPKINKYLSIESRNAYLVFLLSFFYCIFLFSICYLINSNIIIIRVNKHKAQYEFTKIKGLDDSIPRL